LVVIVALEHTVIAKIEAIFLAKFHLSLSGILFPKIIPVNSLQVALIKQFHLIQL
jgi:hypothetical protein